MPGTHNRPTAPQWCCIDCRILEANGDGPAEMSEDDLATWEAGRAAIIGDAQITLGMLAEYHECTDDDGTIADECECERNSFSWSPCDMCGSNLGGERAAFTFWLPGDDDEPAPPELGKELSGPLDSVMEFGHVVYVSHAGTVHDLPDTISLHAPGVCVGSDEDGQISAEDDAEMIRSVESAGWSLLNGWSRQYSYAGPIMHPSEFIGGALAEYILGSPGYYAAVSVETLDDSGDAAGWAIAYRETSP